MTYIVICQQCFHSSKAWKTFKKNILHNVWYLAMIFCVWKFWGILYSHALLVFWIFIGFAPFILTETLKKTKNTSITRSQLCDLVIVYIYNTLPEQKPQLIFKAWCHDFQQWKKYLDPLLSKSRNIPMWKCPDRSKSPIFRILLK